MALTQMMFFTVPFLSCRTKYLQIEEKLKVLSLEAPEYLVSAEQTSIKSNTFPFQSPLWNAWKV